MAINLTTKVSPKILDAFKIGSCTEGIFSSDYTFEGARSVIVHTVDDLPVNEYDRTLVNFSTTPSRFGTLTEVGDTFQTMEMTKELAQNGSIDKANDTDRAITIAATKVIRQNLDHVIIPTMDKYRLTKLAAGYTGWTDDNEYKNTQSATNASFASGNALIKAIMVGNAAMSNSLVPDTGRVLYMGYTLSVDMKLADAIINLEKAGEEALVNGVCGKLDKCQIRLVPDSWMPTNVNFMIVAKGCACAPVKLSTARVLTDNPQIDGSNVQIHYYHDCFVFNQKAAGIYVNKKA